MVAVGTIVWLSQRADVLRRPVRRCTSRSARSEPSCGPSSTEKLNIPFAAVNTIILVVSSVWCQLGVLQAERGSAARAPVRSLARSRRWGMREWYVLTYVFGAFFIAGQVYEYAELVQRGRHPLLRRLRLGLLPDHRLPRHARHRRPHRLPAHHRPHLHDPPLHARAGHRRRRHVLLLALRRRRVDRPVHHDLRARSDRRRNRIPTHRSRRTTGPHRERTWQPAAGTRPRSRSCCCSACSSPAPSTPSSRPRTPTPRPQALSADAVAGGQAAVPGQLRHLPRPQRRGPATGNGDEAGPAWSASVPRRSTSRSAPAGCRWPGRWSRRPQRRGQVHRGADRRARAYVASLGPGPGDPATRQSTPTKRRPGPGRRALPRQLRDVPQLRRRRRCADPRQVRARARRRHEPSTSTRRWSPARSRMPVFNDANITPESKRDIIAFLNDHREQDRTRAA